MKVVIVGAGPAGLVACKTLLQTASEDFPFDPVVLEQEDDIGGTFRYRSYEVGYANLSCETTEVNVNPAERESRVIQADFRLPLDHPDHLTLEEYVEYLRSYSKHFEVEPRIQLNCKVVKVSKAAGGGHDVSYVRRASRTDEWETDVVTIHAKYLVLCTGLHVTPSAPTIPGIEYVINPVEEAGQKDSRPKPAVFHSTDYKSRDQLRGRRVMVLGTGETGMDLAYESAKAGAKEVVLCTRGGFLSFPKALNDFSLFGIKFTSEHPVPIDSLITNLGETAYVHPWVEKSHLRWFVSDFVIKRVLWFLTGTTAGCNQWVCRI
ncbi:hypothetical protein M422DRAFT_275375 [Sphaerobolus stellatus SS14]|uniref:Flavin-containing monooxygenase n=1 Tax=Sphaerobolus stellatus (strain SS14) TaxID=990650 RepID=A0A0C9U4D7_SPHS4|nr:hypothetical protein M422DRAFT_275375 [Sphaerobolus stellatus SS14]